jgi:hypothetical protein
LNLISQHWRALLAAGAALIAAGGVAYAVLGPGADGTDPQPATHSSGPTTSPDEGGQRSERNSARRDRSERSSGSRGATPPESEATAHPTAPGAASGSPNKKTKSGVDQPLHTIAPDDGGGSRPSPPADHNLNGPDGKPATPSPGHTK